MLGNRPRQREAAVSYPDCVLCHDPCICGQRDAAGRDVHYLCQLERLDPNERHPRLPQHPRTTAGRPNRRAVGGCRPGCDSGGPFGRSRDKPGGVL